MWNQVIQNTITKHRNKMEIDEFFGTEDKIIFIGILFLLQCYHKGQEKTGIYKNNLA